jgi:hypothetical protein
MLIFRIKLNYFNHRKLMIKIRLRWRLIIMKIKSGNFRKYWGGGVKGSSTNSKRKIPQG